ncbi:MAG: OB-fold domain-containing protein [Deltaproteobacteria bacterium]|nr:OB-fold domain-containing protein [Deltaproteobacteria bacterium]
MEAPPGMDGRKFIEDGWFRDFGRGMALAGGRCPACGRIYFPAKTVCPGCFGADQQSVPLSGKGTLHTYARSCMGPSGIETPYYIGFIDLPEGIRLFSLLAECEPWEEVLSVGMEMEMVIGPIRRDEEGAEIVSYMFRPSRVTPS